MNATSGAKDAPRSDGFRKGSTHPTRYLKIDSGPHQIAARGFQEIGCMRLTDKGLVPISVPPSLAEALRRFQRVGWVELFAIPIMRHQVAE